MSQSLSKDGKNFVEGVVACLRRGKNKTSMPKVETLLTKISTQARQEKIAYVESAIPLTPKETGELGDTLAKLVGHEIEISSSVNTDIIAGMRIKIADFIVDTSYVSKLSEMAAILTR